MLSRTVWDLCGFLDICHTLFGTRRPVRSNATKVTSFILQEFNNMCLSSKTNLIYCYSWSSSCGWTWQVIHPPMVLRILEGNSAVIAVISTGSSQKLRHLAKAHRVNAASTCEVASSSDDVLIQQHVPSEDQRSDIMTKGLAPQKWSSALMLLNMKFIT